MGIVGMSSRTGLDSGMPYVAAVEENIMCRTPPETADSIRLRLLAVLLL
jgi:hypothetical protein